MSASIGPVVFLLCSFSVAVLTLSGKGYFCRDPDTGKLYPVNTTWAAMSFCGNYTCRTRKKTTLKTEIPLREFTVKSNVSRAVKSKSAEEDNESINLEVAESKNIITTVYPSNYNKLSKVPEKNLESNYMENKINTKVPTDKDRYLTDSEIKTISKLLHNVKKSDLDAIVDIYNLAQDVYKKIDTKDTNDIAKEPIKTANNKGLGLRSKSYWYEPLNRFDKANPDMDSHATVIQPKVAPLSNTYFQGPLLRNDFGVLPYYYPMSDFQRQSSYVHPLAAQRANTPCEQAPKLYATVVSPYRQVYNGVTKKPFAVENKNFIQPSLLLPYPYSYIQHYNMSNYPYNSYYENPLHSYNTNFNYQQDRKAVAHDGKKSGSAFKSDKSIETKPVENEVLKDSEYKLPKHRGLLDTLIKNAKIEIKKPDWPTDPLSANILDDIKSHFEEKSKLFMPFSQNKKKKLERVGKVKRIEVLERNKRSADANLAEDEESFEIYLEETKCHSDVDPGYYKMGNLSQPYPECCPQRIEREP